MDNTFQDTFEIPAYWWLPRTSPDDGIHGVVYFDSEKGIRLKIDGNFEGEYTEGLFQFRPVPSGTRYASIHGIAEDGRQIYLLDCYDAGREIHIPGIDKVIWMAQYLLIGHIPGFPEVAEVPQFQHFHVNFTHLEEWANFSPISQEYGRDENGDDWVQTRFVNKKSLAIPISEFPDWSVSFAFSVDLPQEPGVREKIWRQTTSLAIEATTPQPVSWLKEKVDALQKLVAIFTAEAIYPRIIEAFGRSADNKLSVVAIYYASPRNRWVDSISSHHILLCANEFYPAYLGNVVEQWFQRDEFIRPLSDHHLGLIYNKQLPVLCFLSLTQALEGYHRIRVGGQYISEEEYKPYKEKLEELVKSFTPSGSLAPESFQSMKTSLINGCIQFGYQYSFLKRLKDLWNLLDKEVQASLGFDFNYLTTLKDSRNHYTHLDPAGAPHALKGSDLRTANNRLGAFVLLLILRELDVPHELQLRVLKRLRERRGLT